MTSAFKRDKTERQQEDRAAKQYLSFTLREIFFKGCEIESKMYNRTGQENPAQPFVNSLVQTGGRMKKRRTPVTAVSRNAPVVKGVIQSRVIFMGQYFICKN